MERLTKEFVTAVPRTLEEIEEFARTAVGPEGERQDSEGRWRKQGRFVDNPFPKLIAEEIAATCLRSEDNGTFSARYRVDLFAHAARNEWYLAKSASRPATRDARPLVNNFGVPVIGEGLTHALLTTIGDTVHVMREGEHATAAWLPTGGAPFAGRIIPTPGHRRYSGRLDGPVATREDYERLLPMHQSRPTSYTHHFPCEEALPMFDVQDEILAQITREIQEIDPDLFVYFLTPGWLRQSNTYSPYAQRSEYIPGMDGLLFYGPCGTGGEALIYYDNFAWSLCIGHRAGLVIAGEIFLTSDGKFITTSFCQNEYNPSSGGQQPIVGGAGVYQYNLQSWLAGAGLARLTVQGGGAMPSGDYPRGAQNTRVSAEAARLLAPRGLRVRRRPGGSGSIQYLKNEVRLAGAAEFLAFLDELPESDEAPFDFNHADEEYSAPRSNPYNVPPRGHNILHIYEAREDDVANSDRVLLHILINRRTEGRLPYYVFYFEDKENNRRNRLLTDALRWGHVAYRHQVELPESLDESLAHFLGYQLRPAS